VTSLEKQAEEARSNCTWKKSGTCSTKNLSIAESDDPKGQVKFRSEVPPDANYKLDVQELWF